MRLGAAVLAKSVFGLLVFTLCLRCTTMNSFSADLDAVVAGLQQRYASVTTMTGSFRQIFRAPGIEQIESGVFRMKRPGLMRWEYRQPEEKLFIADGREAHLYVPQDRQVTVQPFSASDLRGTPLEFLLGGADILNSFVVSWENSFKPVSEQVLLIRLTPRRGQSEYAFLVLELDPKNYDLRRITIHEHGGNTSEFILSNMTANAKIDNREFQFKPPKGTEIIRMEEGK
ncbi:MAG TPA: outer membrane lipoprotein chaperone LolA [Acidobacteriota bacterium]|nr:outer membrane lipoprotein chaperone LolA [Acidobacteriota bacterium]